MTSAPHHHHLNIMNTTNLNLIDRLTEPYRASLEHLYSHHLLGGLFSGNEPLAEFTINTALSIGLYWALGLLYLAVDLLQPWSVVLLRYKVQAPNPNRRPPPITSVTLSRLARQVLANQLLTAVLSGAILLGKSLTLKSSFFNYHHHHHHHHHHHRFPPLTRLALEWAVFTFVRELLFYYSHRALHHPLLYRAIHKRHHEWTAPIALTSIYCHPVEHVISNLFPVIAGPLLLASHPLVTFAWEAYVVVITMHHHCGYHFPFTPFSPVFHDFHHLRGTGNFGIFGFFDWLHGTDRLFRASPNWPLDRMYFSLTPPAPLGSGAGARRMKRE
ncbi:hypothetical protein TYRP_020190 [Tyrophagus putrescentiae]|nr:hypothetical protein TYRP_020190 [Tyrophagus putrescentiae]